MNKYKVLVNDYRKALLIDNKIREGKIEKKIKSILKYLKKPISFGVFKLNIKEEDLLKYEEKLRNNTLVDFKVLDYNDILDAHRIIIRKNNNKIIDLELVKDEYFEADDETLNFIREKLEQENFIREILAQEKLAQEEIN